MSIRKKHKSQIGFTLIEMLVVVAIIATLAAIVGPKVIGGAEKARITANKATISNIEGALQRYKLDNYFYPSTDQGLEALVEKPVGTPEPKNWTRPYLKKMPLDPWKNPYYYTYPGENGEFDIYTLGADGIQGGEGEAADVGNWDID